MIKELSLILLSIIIISAIVVVGCISLFNYWESSSVVEATSGDILVAKSEKPSEEILVAVLNSKSNDNSSKAEKKEKTDENEQEKKSDKTEEKEKDENKKTAEEETKVEKEEKLPYYIKVNYQQNVVNIYKLDENNEYTVPYKAFICSTGTATPTEGTYKTDYKYRWLALFGDVYGQYCTRIVGNILFHSVPYLEKENSGSLEYWEYDKLGESCSMGCIRLTIADAKWIYDNCESGTVVEFYADENPGPFGKPTSMKISDEEEYRDWDPTDPSEENPWP